MPHKFYHGRTGVVWNVTKRAVGVEMNKQVNGRIIRKRLHVRVEHVQPSRCREEFLKRRASNDAIKADAKKKGGACTMPMGLCADRATAAVMMTWTALSARVLCCCGCVFLVQQVQHTAPQSLCHRSSVCPRGLGMGSH